MERRVHLTAGPVLVIATSLLLAAGFRLNEEPAVATAFQAVRARPMANASAAAHWALGALGADDAERVGSPLPCGRKGR
jgi:hypothetical protein